MAERRASPRFPMRTCVGCRVSAVKSNLLRVVVVKGELTLMLTPDPCDRLPGRGAYVHPDLRCLDLAERRRAFPRAFRLPGPFEITSVRTWIEAQGVRQTSESNAWARTRAGQREETGRDAQGRSMSKQQP